MKVIGLFDNFSDSIELWYEIEKKKQIDFWVLICNNSDSTVLRFYLRIFLRFLKYNSKAKILFLKLLIDKKLIISVKNIHDGRILLWIRKKNFDIGLHYTGIIYRKELISLFKLGIINPHIGILPKYRGRSVMEWAIFNGDPTGITAFFIDEGIDTGKNIITIEEIGIKGFDSNSKAKDFMFDKRKKILAKAINLLLKKDFKFKENKIENGLRYYKMSDLFKGIVEDILRNEKR